MLRICDDVGKFPGFDDLSLVHDHDVVADTIHHRQIMGDEQTRTAFKLGIEQIEDLSLNDDIERCGGFVT